MQYVTLLVVHLQNLGDEDDGSSDEYSYPSASKRRLIGKASTQRSKHNKNNRIRLRAISDRISQLRVRCYAGYRRHFCLMGLASHGG